MVGTKLSILKEGEGKQKVNHVTVFERPGLQEFLQQISKFADLVLFTAGLEGFVVYPFTHYFFILKMIICFLHFAE